MAKVLAQEKQAAAKREADLQDLRDKRRALNSTAAVVGSAAPATKKETPASRRLSMLERLDSEKEAREHEERKREELEREERQKAREERLEKAARAAKEAGEREREARARAKAAQEKTEKRAKDTDERVGHEKREAKEKNERAKAKEEEEKMEREAKEKEKAGETVKRDERANGREERNDNHMKEKEEKEKEKSARKASVHKETARERERARKQEAKEQAKREREARKQARRQLQKKKKQPAAATKKDETKVLEAKKAAVVAAAANEDEVDESLTSSAVHGGTMMLAAPIMGRDSQQPPASRGGLTPLPLASTLSPSPSSTTSTPSAFKTYSRPTNPPPFTLILPRVNLPQPPLPPVATTTVQQPPVVIVPDSKPVPSASYSMVPIDAPLADGTKHKADDAIELPPSATAIATVVPKRRGRPKKGRAEPAAEPPVKRKSGEARRGESHEEAPGRQPWTAVGQRRQSIGHAGDDRYTREHATALMATVACHVIVGSVIVVDKIEASSGQGVGRADVVALADDEKEKEGKNEKEPKKRRKKESGDEQKKKRKRKRETKRETYDKEEEEEGLEGDDDEGITTNEKREGAQTSGRRNRTNLKALHKRRRLTPVSMAESAEGDKPTLRSRTAAIQAKAAFAGVGSGGAHPEDKGGGKEGLPQLEKMLDGFTTLLDSAAEMAQGATARKSPSPSPSPAQLVLPPLPRPSIPMGGLEEGYQGFLATCTNYFDAKQQREALASPLPPPLQSPHQAGPLSPMAKTVPPSEPTVATVVTIHDAPAPILLMSPAADDPQSATTDLPTITDERTTETQREPQFFHGREGEEGSPSELGMQLGANLSSSDSGGVRSHLVSPFSDILREFNIDASDVHSGGGAYKQQPHQSHPYVHHHHANYFGLPTSPLDMFMVHPHEQDPFGELSGGGYAPFLSFPADDVSPYYSPSPLPHESGEKTPGLGAAGDDMGSKSGDGSNLPVLVTNLDTVDVVLASGKTYSHNIGDSRRVPTPTPTFDAQSLNARLMPTSAAAPTRSPFVSYSGQRLPTATPPFRATPPSGAQSSPHDGTNCLQTQLGSTDAASPHPSGSSGQNAESDGGEHRIRFYVQLRKGNETVPIRVNKGLTFSGLKKLGMEHWGVKAMSPKLFRVYDRHGAFTVGRDLVVNEAVSNECFTLVQLSHDSTSGDSIGDDSTAPRQ
ncbi:uncharacterized protein ACA1_269370 [Acanthamoeba castellanii str. Neff]|uniref:Ubiquitin-like domain-containing protein n=1 Tax=Acanthamoeba castellanii (strain ATCC 30010 / Neff) TaxID=1257118 RepID=L8H4Z0_ACACF|nr:uncharacterized protein ACA1_269370 [Acanthamoeba castellanii str. Neff]ELR19516.1 hypothetical protein ACA1_269370 [Acanthamoeba castellanii str. Neff]